MNEGDQKIPLPEPAADLLAFAGKTCTFATSFKLLVFYTLIHANHRRNC